MTAEAPYKLTAWVDEQRKAAPATVSNSAAEARLVAAMTHFGYPASIWARRTWMVGDRVKSTFVERGMAAVRREQVWLYLRREPDPPSYPEIARACGMPSHSTIVMAVQRLRNRARTGVSK